MSWGVVEAVNEDGTFDAFHVVPMVRIDGEYVASEAHTLTRDCPCRPRYEHGDEYDTDIWNHNDPDHPGSRETTA